MVENSINKDRNGGNALSVFAIYTAITLVIYILPYFKYVLPYIYVALFMLVSLPILAIKKNRWLIFTIVFCYTAVVLAVLYRHGGIVNFINDFVSVLRFFLPNHTARSAYIKAPATDKPVPVFHLKKLLFSTG